MATTPVVSSADAVAAATLGLDPVNIPAAIPTPAGPEVSEKLTATEEKVNAALTPEPKKLTIKEFKQLLAKFFTVRNNIVEMCGHPIGQDREPKMVNCEYCWFAYFQTHGKIVQVADECFQSEGKEMLERIKGKKFVKHFIRFMAIVARMKEINDKRKVESNGKIPSIGESEGNSEAAGSACNDESCSCGPVEGTEAGRGHVEQTVQDDQLPSTSGQAS